MLLLRFCTSATILSTYLTFDCFYNGFLQNVPSLLLLVTKLFSLIARLVIF